MDHALQYLSDNIVLVIFLWFLSIFIKGFVDAFAADWLQVRRDKRAYKRHIEAIQEHINKN